jgi:hypothetical protein
MLPYYENEDALDRKVCSFEDLEQEEIKKLRKSDCALDRLLPEYRRNW